MRALQLFIQPTPVTDIELFKFAIQMRALKAGFIGDARHATAFLLDQMLEVHALKRIACFAQRDIQ
jgi:hypothetical protein